MQPLDRLLRLGTDRIGDGKPGEHPGVLEHVHHALPSCSSLVRERLELGCRCDFHPLEQYRTTDRDPAPFSDCLDPVAGNRTELPRAGNDDLPLARARHDRLSNGMLRILLDRRRQAKHRILALARRDAHGDHPVRAERERSSLVEEHCRELTRLLQATAVTDKQSALRAERGGDGDDEGDG